MESIREAHARIRDKVHRTPVMTSEVLDRIAGSRLYFKCENLQKAGAFKARGATNAVFLLTDEEAARGVVTHSSGNHAAALARAAALRGIPAYIVMPNNSPLAKQAAVRRYGGDIVLCEPTLAAREATARQVMERTGAAFIHPYDDLRVMAGQGTTAIELLEEVPHLDVILCPVGGGGQLSGIAVAAKDIKPDIRVIGVEPAGADDAARSLKAREILPMVNPRTIADGLKTSLGERPFAVIIRLVDDIVTVSEDSIVQAMRQILEVMKLLVEPSGAVPYAAILEKKVSGKDIGIILSGGNLDLDRLPWQ
ncbi:MAG: threonine dehydratase [Gammaproteobacteria bacterium]|jgi:threonine dehydratase|nr:serine dehydratase [Gammaproteobacteria bacterium]MEA3138242.1 threonine dehydratase [Gammaproteobacteria bacterium]